MILTRLTRAVLFTLLCGALTAVAALPAVAQDTNQATRVPAKADRTEEVNLDTQLYLILATNRDVDESKIPLALEPVIQRLRESLPFKHYNLAATFLNRVRDNGHLDVSWVGAPLLVSTSAAMSNPTFSQFSASVKLGEGEGGREVVLLRDFRFGSRVPIVTGQVGATSTSTGAPMFPVVNYEPIGLHTDISMREGEPVVAGTLTVGPSGDALIVAVSVKRAPR
jgi:hypothetical protein